MDAGQRKRFRYGARAMQVAIVPVGADQFAYGAEVQAVLRNEVDVHARASTHAHLGVCLDASLVACFAYTVFGVWPLPGAMSGAMGA